jgi:hypothetical protein
MGKAPLSRYVYVYIIQVDKIKCMEMNEMIINNRYGYRIPLSPMGVLAPRSAHARPSTRAPIGTSGNVSQRDLSGQSGHNWEIYFIGLFHVSEHVDHFKAIKYC